MADQVELLYTKSKVYLHPTSSKKDNIPGYLSLSKISLAKSKKDIELSFTPEFSLLKEDLELFKSFDLSCDISKNGSELLLGMNGSTLPKSSRLSNGKESPRISKSSIGSSNGGFNVPLLHIYLIQFRNPSLGWWYGSVILHAKTDESFPILFFHDDESPLTISNQKQKNSSFNPFEEDGLIYWGGHDFLQALESLTNIEHSSIEPSVYLVDPNSVDSINFSPYKNKKEANNSPEAFKLLDVNKFLTNAKWKVLETVATFTQRTKNLVQNIVEDNIPQNVINLILSKSEVQKISNDFESARVYLAKWASQVKEEAEQSRRKFHIEEALYSQINKELEEESKLLTPQEVCASSRRKPICLAEWEGFFDSLGRLAVTVEEVKSRVFHAGLQKEARKEAWPFLLGVYDFDSTLDERSTIFQSLQTSYCDFKRRWVDDEQKRETDYWKDQKVRIEKDVHRNDRNLDIFKSKNKKGDRTKNVSDSTVESSQDRENHPENNEEDDEWDLSKISNPHLFKMREILLTFNEYNINLGYVQGMTDLLSPIYVVFQDETMSFWLFSKFMERMERNFVRDQSGMKTQMLVLNELVQFMLPDLFRHLEKCDSTHLFFFFRMLLVWFKREFEWEQVNTLWEVLWSDYYSGQYHLFVALAILSDHERIIIQNLKRFDEVLKYINDLLGKFNLDALLVRAELLFLRFQRMVDLLDREGGTTINPDLRNLLSKKIVIQQEKPREVLEEQ